VREGWKTLWLEQNRPFIPLTEEEKKNERKKKTELAKKEGQ